jgi:uncharacterized protein YqgV (UPF0045/DUF77 family)
MAEKRPGYMESAVMGCQFSVYPLHQPEIDGAVQAAIKAAAARCPVKVGNLSTLMWGEEDQVFEALQEAYRAVREYGPAVMTATFAAGMPTDELVGQIQTDAVEQTKERS